MTREGMSMPTDSEYLEYVLQSCLETLKSQLSQRRSLLPFTGQLGDIMKALLLAYSKQVLSEKEIPAGNRTPEDTPAKRSESPRPPKTHTPSPRAKETRIPRNQSELIFSMNDLIRAETARLAEEERKKCEEFAKMQEALKASSPSPQTIPENKGTPPKTVKKLIY